MPVSTMLNLGIDLVERGFGPDFLVRRGIRQMCAARLRETAQAADDRSPASMPPAQAEFLESLSRGPIALRPEKANEQHYELPPEFFAAVLGPRRKYSCCHFDTPESTLEQAERSALRITCERAELADGQSILELGCGWGSLSLWMAEHYPESRITAVSNSRPQREFIEAAAREQGLDNLEVRTADMNDFAAEAGAFDRIVSVEMFEHMRNYRALLGRVADWLRPGGKLFVHIFCHRTYTYPFEDQGEADWMARHFFTGGMMPGEDLLRRFAPPGGDAPLRVARQWAWSGQHYRRTADAWLERLDGRYRALRNILSEVYGRDDGIRWFYRWRMFFLAVSELFGYADGSEWFVQHSLLERSGSPVAKTDGLGGTETLLPIPAVL